MSKGEVSPTFEDHRKILLKEWKVVSTSILVGAILTLVLAVLLNIGDQAVKAFIIQQTELRVQSYLGRFFVSPAVGGIAALAAAAITAAVISAQLRHTKTKDREVNWWERYEWITERAFPSKSENNGNAISQEFAGLLLNQLEAEAVTNLQKKACSNFMSLVVRKENLALETTEAADEQPEVAVGVPSDMSDVTPSNTPVDAPTDKSEEMPAKAPASVPRLGRSANDQWAAAAIGVATARSVLSSRASRERAFEVAREYVESTRGTASGSAEAEVFVLRHELETALAEAKIDFRIQTNPDSDQITVRHRGGRFDIVALPWDKEKARRRVSALGLKGRPVLAIFPNETKDPNRLQAWGVQNIWVKFWNPDLSADNLAETLDDFAVYLERKGLLEKPPYRYDRDALL